MNIVVLFLLLILTSGFGLSQTEEPRPPNIDPDRFYNISPEEERVRLDSFFAELANFPGEGLIDIRCDRKNTRKQRVDRIRRIVKHIRYRKFNIRRISFRISEGDYHVTTFWRVDDGISWLLDEDKEHKVIKAEEFETKHKALFP